MAKTQVTFMVALAMLGAAAGARAQTPAAPSPPTVEIYGFGQADAIADFKQNNPDWYDTVRPSRLPNVANQFGQDGHFYLSARQSRLGARATLPTSSGGVKAQFEFLRDFCLVRGASKSSCKNPDGRLYRSSLSPKIPGTPVQHAETVENGSANSELRVAAKLHFLAWVEFCKCIHETHYASGYQIFNLYVLRKLLMNPSGQKANDRQMLQEQFLLLPANG